MIILLPHAERQLLERNIDLKEIEEVLLNPDQTLETNISGRKIAQKVLSRNGTKFLYRVIYSKESEDHLVITTYRTTKINKYLKGD